MKKIISLLLTLALTLGLLTVCVSAETTTEPAKKYLALAFDDGPNNTTAVDLLDVLKKHNVPATFFCIGTNCTTDTADTLKRMVAQGCEIGMHGNNHENFSGWTADRINANLQTCSDTIYNLCSVRPTLLRLPYLGMPDKKVAPQIPYPLIAGSGPVDYVTTPVEDRLQGILDSASDGFIYLLHCFEGNDNTVQAVDRAIPKLIEEGYTFVTVSDLFKVKGVTPTLGYQWYQVPDGKDINYPENSTVFDARSTRTKNDSSFYTLTQTDIAPFNSKMIYSKCKVGQRLECTLKDLKPGEYKLYCYLRTDSDRGECELTVNDTQYLGKIDQKTDGKAYHCFSESENGEFIIKVGSDGQAKLSFKTTREGVICLDKFALVKLSSDILFGDTNNDGAINMKDVLVMRKFIAGMNVEINEEAADVNHDERINMKDVLLMRKFIANIITSFD